MRLTNRINLDKIRDNEVTNGRSNHKTHPGYASARSFSTSQLIECASAVLSSSEAGAVLHYGPVGGYHPLREQIALEAGVEEKRVIIGQGFLQLQDMIAKLLVKPGDLV